MTRKDGGMHGDNARCSHWVLGYIGIHGLPDLL